MKKSEFKVIKVSAKSPVPQTAGSIIISLESGDRVELRAIGASATNQLVKAVASARGTLASKGRDLYMSPGFDTIKENDETKTVLVAYLKLL